MRLIWLGWPAAAVGATAAILAMPRLPAVDAEVYMVRDTPVARDLPKPQSRLVENTLEATQGVAVDDRLIPLADGVAFRPAELAPGLRVDAAGRVTGTPLRPGSYTDDLWLCRGDSCERDEVITTVYPDLPWQPVGLTCPGAVGKPLESRLGVTGGPDGVLATYTVTDLDALPAGVTLGPDGHLSGTPARAGVYEVPVRICVAGDCTGAVVTFIIA